MEPVEEGKKQLGNVLLIPKFLVFVRHRMQLACTLWKSKHALSFHTYILDGTDVKGAVAFTFSRLHELMID